ncbi:MAG: hypothetical protein K2K82_01700 [Muribaculaceae bacterium]|nr:hypothetical protein [Muribaculaceae bacterium]
MKKVLFLMLLFIGAISGKAQTLADLKGNFMGLCDEGIECYMVLDPTEPSIEAKGCLTYDSKTHSFVKVSSKPIAIKCYGKFVMRICSTNIVYNILAVEDADEFFPPNITIAYEDDTNPDEVLHISIFSEDGGKTFQMGLISDPEDPIFEKAIIKRYVP